MLRTVSSRKESRHMLETLRRIVQDVSAAPDLPSALAITVNQIRDAMHVAACTVYLADEDNREYVLMATAGLNPRAVGRVRLSRQQGLIGLVAERQEPLNLEDAAAPSRGSIWSSDVDEEDYHAFLGVPLIQYRRVLGVLTVQHTASRQFHPPRWISWSPSPPNWPAPSITPFSAAPPRNCSTRWRFGTRALQGMAGAPGVAMGIVTIPHLLAELDDVPDRRAFDPAAEEAAFRAAIATVDDELRVASERLRRCCRRPNRRCSPSTA
jgi:phosphotransferase system enzyme I (PtsP)